MALRSNIIPIGKAYLPVRFQGTDAEGRYVKEVVVPSPIPGLVANRIIGEARPPKAWWDNLPNIIDSIPAVIDEMIAATQQMPSYFKPGAETMLSAAARVIQEQVRKTIEVLTKLRNNQPLTPPEEHQAAAVLENSFDRLSGMRAEMAPLDALHEKVCRTNGQEAQKVQDFLKALGEGPGNQRFTAALKAQQEAWEPVVKTMVEAFIQRQQAEEARRLELDVKTQGLPQAVLAQLGLGNTEQN